VKIAHEQSHAWLQGNLVPWLASRLGIPEASLYSFKNCVAELFNNIQDHTQYDIGSIFVQHFPAEKSVTISLSDFGIGIPAKVQEKLPKATDPQAIIEAVKEGFTTKSNPGNKGIGLDYLLKTVVLGNGGQVTILLPEWYCSICQGRNTNYPTRVSGSRLLSGDYFRSEASNQCD